MRSKEATVASVQPTKLRFGRVARWLRKSRFGLAAFLIALAIRSIPEIIVGPYPIGWDTIAFYVPNTVDWAGGKAGWLTMLGTAPLMYMITVPVYMISHVNPVWIFKVMGPVLYGSMIFALFRFLRQGLEWNPRQALGGALLTSLYFVTLRVSWDLYRNMLGLTFILLALVFLRNPRGLKIQSLLALSVLGAVGADQLTGVIVLVLVGTRAFAELLKGHKTRFIDLVGSAIPGATLFLSIVYAGLLVSRAAVVQGQPPVPSVENLSTSMGFLGYAYLPLSPLIVLGVRIVPNADLKNWSVLCTVAAATALLPFFGLVVASYRWSLLLSIPFCVFAAAGIDRLRALRPRALARRRLEPSIIPVLSGALILLAILYIALPAQQAMPYYAAFPSLLPTSMMQDTVPFSDMQNLRAMLDRAATSLGPSTALITHQAIYGWAVAYLPSMDHIVNYAYSNPLEGVQMARASGYSAILMIWWVNGLGWHGQPSVPEGFVPLVKDGNMALYAYY